MPFATISTKGQITLPAQLRRRFGIKAHDRVEVDASADGIVIKPIGDFLELEGILGRGRPRQEERDRMARAVADHVEGKKQ